MRVAVDVNISNREIGELARCGDEVVCVAGVREEDSSWLDRALARGAEVIISQDLDIPNLLDKWNVSEGVFWFERIEDYLDWRDGHVRNKRKKVGKNKRRPSGL